MVRKIVFLLMMAFAGWMPVHSHAQPVYNRPASLGITGDTADVQTETRGGVALIGGGGDVPAAFQWMIERAGGGNAVVLRASGDYLYNETIFRLGKLHSVETLLIDSREKANDEAIARVIRNAELLFISGGDQSNYMRFWRNTRVSEAINYLLNTKKVPVGGTSAGCAILTGFYYSGETESATSSILKNPFDSTVTLYNNDFLQPPFLLNVLSDQHYVTRKRQGRHVCFLARIINDWHVYANGIAPDEQTAVCVDEKGMARVFGKGKAYFLHTVPGKMPEQCKKDLPLEWNLAGKAIHVFEIQGSKNGNGRFSVSDFNENEASGGNWQWWWVSQGILHQDAE